jgi:outer membrane receptor for monomeric catechols
MKTPSLQKLTLCAALAFAPAVMSVAQSAPTPPPAVDEEETVVLSPFTVNTSKDVGYLAGNTLAGSRLNTKLKDTGAAISVLTPEFLKDIGATNMKDVILFQNNAVPDFGDAAGNVNGNPMIGNDEWQLRIRGLPASYARNYFKWDASSDFYNVERIDQARGPNSILFGFGSPGGIVNTSTKQAQLNKWANEIGFAFGSWNRIRGTLDSNMVLVPGKLALRANVMAENGDTWREFEYDHSRRGHLALKFQPNKTSSIRLEGEAGKIDDNVARPWLATDQSYLWRNAGRPTYTGTWPSGPTIATFWPDHRVVADDGVVRNWLGYGYGSNANGASAATGWNAPTWSAIAETPQNLAIIPMNSNLGGPDATRETKYNTISAFYENQVTDKFSFELAFNHQSSDFSGYDADGGRATTYYGNSSELWGDASNTLPDVWGNAAGTNPNAGKLYLENNWTRRVQSIRSNELRATAAYNFETGTWGKHRAAGMIDYNQRDFARTEYCEAFLDISGWAYDPTKAEADVNRVYRRHYFQPGNTKDIHVASWKNPVAGTGWVTNQPPENTQQKQWTGMVALQSFFFDDKLVATVGFRGDSMDYTYDIGAAGLGTRDAVTKQWRLDPATARSTTLDANTLTAGAVYHTTKWLSIYGNGSSSRDIPDVRIHIIGSDLPPMAESKGGDVGIKLDLLDGKVYLTAGYYKTKTLHMTDWGNVQTSVTDRNTKVLDAFVRDGLITSAERASRLINANGYMMDRDSSGWEFSGVANPTKNWRISANFSINHVVARNSMAEVKAWSDANTAWWNAKTASTPTGSYYYPLTVGTTWDYLGANIGWMNGDISQVTGLDGHEARGQRQYGANLYTKYTFDNGFLKNFSIGGGGRYQSANVAGFYYNEVRYGKSLTLADASLGYTFNLSKGTWVEVQLNVSNLLDTDRTQIYTYAWWDTTAKTPGNVGLQEPRKYTLSASLHF